MPSRGQNRLYMSKRHYILAYKLPSTLTKFKEDVPPWLEEAIAFKFVKVYKKDNGYNLLIEKDYCPTCDPSNEYCVALPDDYIILEESRSYKVYDKFKFKTLYQEVV